MEQRVEITEALRDRSRIHDGNGQTTQRLSASEQFYTRSCTRCSGLIVNEWCCDLENTGEDGARVLRCVQCGHRVYSVILQNQTRPSVRRRDEPRQRCSLKTVLLDGVA